MAKAKTASLIVLNECSTLGSERVKESKFQSCLKTTVFVSNDFSIALRFPGLKRHGGGAGQSGPGSAGEVV